MANNSHRPRTRKRTTQYTILTFGVIQHYFPNYEVGENYVIWINKFKKYSGFKMRLSSDRIFVYDRNGGYEILFETTKIIHGQRKWFLCPTCNRRATKLYLDGVFSCRLCVKPAYQCQNSSRLNYLGTKVVRLRRALWGKTISDDLLSNLGAWSRVWEKPPRMHWKTFERKRNEIIELERIRILIIAKSGGWL